MIYDKFHCLLFEDSSIRAEEAVFGETTVSIAGTDVEGLAVSFRISIVAFNLGYNKILIHILNP